MARVDDDRGIQISFWMDPEQHRHLKEAARAEFRTMAAQIRAFIDEGLDARRRRYEASTTAPPAE